MTESPTEVATGTSRRSLVRRVVQATLSLGLGIAILVFVLPQIADLSEVWTQIQDMTGLELLVLALATAWNLVTYWILLVICTPGLRWNQAMVVTETTTAVSNTVPAGGAVAVGLYFGMLGSWGFSKARISVSAIVSGIWNNFAKLAMPIMAVSILALQGGAGGGRILSACIGFGALVAAVVIFALILRSEEFAGKVGIVAGRIMSKLRAVVRKGPVSGWDHAVVKFRSQVIGLVSRRWAALTFWTLVGHFSLYAVLLVALREIGVSNEEVGWAEVLAVFAFARLLTAIPLTPGGIGVIELALIAGLDAAGGNHEQVVGAVLLFRALTYVLPILFGLVTYVFWRRNRSWRDSAPPLPPELVASMASTTG
ncbi:MAG: lysylphosphatidylglycerol synthase transmembrane domain-containing protein [Acidimicrobiia bacterium]